MNLISFIQHDEDLGLLILDSLLMYQSPATSAFTFTGEYNINLLQNNILIIQQVAL